VEITGHTQGFSHKNVQHAFVYDTKNLKQTTNSTVKVWYLHKTEFHEGYSVIPGYGHSVSLSEKKKSRL
jgi:hypothetical protein